MSKGCVDKWISIPYAVEKLDLNDVQCVAMIGLGELSFAWRCSQSADCIIAET